MDTALLVTILRLLITAGVVVVASLAVERTGPLVAAMIASLPLSTGPAYLFLAVDHEPDFLAATARTSLFSMAATYAFGLVYARVAPHSGTAVSLGLSLLAWAVAIVALLPWDWSVPGALAFVLAVQIGTILATRDIRRMRPVSGTTSRTWQIAVRAISVVCLVGAVGGVAGRAGPRAAGYVSLVPTIFTSLALMMQPRFGGRATAPLMAHGLVGMIGWGFAFAIIAVGAVPLGSALALTGGLAACITPNVVLLLRATRRARPALSRPDRA